MNLAHMIDAHDADRVALIVGATARPPTASCATRSPGCAAGSPRCGVGDGDRVAMLCGNNRYFVVSYLAIVGLGAVAVPLNPASPAPEIERELAVGRRRSP